MAPLGRTRPPATRDTSGRIKLVFFDVLGRRDLAQRAAAAAPGVRLAWRRSWTDDPGESKPSLLGKLRGSNGPPVGLWLWSGSVEQVAAQATDVLLRFVHPLVARGLPFCFGFPFGPEVFAPRRLSIGAAAAFDLEDIGRLLGVSADVLEHPIAHRPISIGASAPASAAGATAAALPGAPAAMADQPPLDRAQRAAVEHRIGAARVLAPAGAGKTKTLIARVVKLVERGVEPSSILMLAFNRKAAEQLEERLSAQGLDTTRRIGSPDGAALPTGVHIATFNAFGYRYQREVMGARIVLDLSGADLRALMRRALEIAGVSLADLQPAPDTDAVGAFMAALTQVRAALQAPADVNVSLHCVGDEPLVDIPFAPVHDAYLRSQRVTGLQSFDDQIYLAVADMYADPHHRTFVQKRFRHVLVDEFQDLNGAQLALVDVLSRPTHDVFVVGDDDQLIYGWRNADPQGILGFHDRMPVKPWSATYTLCTNYRCSRAVVESSARLVTHNAVREPKGVRPRESAPDGDLRFAGAPDWPARAAALCRYLREERSRLGCEWRDLAVLCRYRSQQVPVALALDGEDIPRTATLGCRLFTHRAARLVRRYLDNVVAPARTSSGAGDEHAHGERAGDERAGDERAGGSPCVGLRAALAEGRLITSAELVQAIIDDFELVERFRCELEERRRRDGAGADGADAGGPFQALETLHLLAQMHPSLPAYLAAWDRLLAEEQAYSDAADDTLAREEDDDRVVIGTIHAAKGREYQAVVIPDYDCDLSRLIPAQLEEERRVVYVGVTRAMLSCLFTVDTTTVYVPRFLRELVEEPQPGEHETLDAWYDEEADPRLRRRLADRLAEIEILFPEYLEQ